MIYKQVELKDRRKVQYVGVYVLEWLPEWGEPTVAFIEADYQISDAMDELDRILGPEMSEDMYIKVCSILEKIGR